MLSEFDIKCLNLKSGKGRAISKVLAEGLTSRDENDVAFHDENFLFIGNPQ